MARQKRRKRRNASREKRAAKLAPPVLNKSAPPVRPRLRGWHKGVILVGAMAAVPALFFVSVELGLRVAGYGYPTAFFIPWEVEGQPHYVDNLEFGRRFFSPGLEQPPEGGGPYVASLHRAEPRDGRGAQLAG